MVVLEGRKPSEGVPKLGVSKLSSQIVTLTVVDFSQAVTLSKRKVRKRKL